MSGVVRNCAIALIACSALTIANPVLAQDVDRDALLEELRSLRERLDQIEAQLGLDGVPEPAAEQAGPVAAARDTRPAAAESAVALPEADVAAEQQSVELARYDNISANVDTCDNLLARGDPELRPQLAPADRNGDASRSTFQLLSSNTSTTASLQLSSELSYVCAENASSPGHYQVRGSNLSVTFSAPLDKANDNRTSLVTLDGLANGAKATVNWNFRSLGFNTGGARTADLIQRAIAACGDRANGMSAAECRTSYENPRPGAPISTREFIATYLGEDAALDFDEDGFADVGFIGGLTASLNYADFEFRDIGTGEEVDQSKVGFGIGGHLGLVFPNDNNSVIAAYEFQRSYKAADDEAFCPDDDDIEGSVLRCPIGPAGEPSVRTAHLASLEFRHGGAGDFAIAPRFTYDIHEDRYGIDVPIYLVSSKDGGLTGGIRLGYLSEDEDEEEDEEFIFGLFVDVPFSIFGN